MNDGFLLANTPIIPNFDVEKDEKYLETIKERFSTLKGVKTNSMRYLIVARK